MKKIFALLLFTFFSIALHAQGHLKFQGIPIDGTFATFESRLKQKGWVYDYNVSKSLPANQKVYKGTFAGESGLLVVERSFQSKVVYGVVFNSNPRYSLEDAEIIYNKHVLSLKRTYPDAEIEEDTDGYRVTFTTEKGVIECNININDDDEYLVSLAYIDLINAEKSIEEESSEY